MTGGSSDRRKLCFFKNQRKAVTAISCLVLQVMGNCRPSTTLYTLSGGHTTTSPWAAVVIKKH
ncbi:hypothetical protein DPMN_101350 [Dreissena polymorpha]|uniref:Uncharacterized protein n=1 Tax=Dreissena polymorpha TaxID=45954 RepID=A0A9D4LJA3_DREPO|nr:hypothetical protein DPMN_101350 [Dreissena polymorpha]